jgi:hypothetical protein
LGRTWADLVGLNIIAVGSGGIAFLLMMSWGRMVRGTWPGKTKRLIFVGYITMVIVGCNIFYFYLRSH